MFRAGRKAGAEDNDDDEEDDEDAEVGVGSGLGVGAAQAALAALPQRVPHSTAGSSPAAHVRVCPARALLQPELWLLTCLVNSRFTHMIAQPLPDEMPPHVQGPGWGRHHHHPPGMHGSDDDDDDEDKVGWV